MMNLDFEKDLLAADKKLKEEWGFMDLEIKHITKYKPAFLLYEEDYTRKKSGLLAVNEYLVNKRKFEYEVVKTLIVKYPTILSKTEDQLHKQFFDLKKHNIGKNEAMKYFL
jgi:hypothetical protein